MTEYLIREESLVEIADIIRSQYEYFDLISQRIINPDSLTNVEIPDDIQVIGNYMFYDCDNLTNIIIPDSITTIGDYAFGNCSNLESVTISNSVTAIGNSAFYFCRQLTDIYLHSTFPPTLNNSNAFNTSATTTIHVPIGSGEAYRTATNWSAFADKIVEDIEV